MFKASFKGHNLSIILLLKTEACLEGEGGSGKLLEGYSGNGFSWRLKVSGETKRLKMSTQSIVCRVGSELMLFTKYFAKKQIIGTLEN